MKRSLLSKLLAGIMSLGLVTGGSFAANAVVRNDWNHFEIDDDDDDAKTSSDKNKNGQDKVWAGLCALVDLKSPILSHLFFGEKGEGKLAFATDLVAWIAAYSLDNALSSENNKKIRDVEADRFLVKLGLKKLENLDNEVANLIKFTENPDNLREAEGSYYYGSEKILKENYERAKKYLDQYNAKDRYQNLTMNYLVPLGWILWDVNKIVEKI